MANRIFLVLTHADDPNAPYEAQDIVVAASTMVPILWASVFSVDDIYIRTETWSEQEGEDDDESETFEATYPVLMAPRATIWQRATERHAAFLTLFPPRLEPHYQEWLALLEGVQAPYLLVDTQELWAMGAPEEFDRKLHAYVRAFEHHATPDLAALVNQTHSLRFDAANRQVSPIKGQAGHIPYDLRGYYWLRPVPWKEPGIASQGS